MTTFTDQEIIVGKLKRQGKLNKEVAKELGWSKEQVESVIKSTTAKINKVSDSIDFLTTIGELSGDKVLSSPVKRQKGERIMSTQLYPCPVCKKSTPHHAVEHDLKACKICRTVIYHPEYPTEFQINGKKVTKQ
jgi:hypothetical protein